MDTTMNNSNVIDNNDLSLTDIILRMRKKIADKNQWLTKEEWQNEINIYRREKYGEKAINN